MKGFFKYSILATSALLAAQICHAQFIGQAVNLTQVYGVDTSTGPGKSNSGTQRVILASDSPSGSGSGNTGVYTVTPGTGIWNTTGSSVTVFTNPNFPLVAVGTFTGIVSISSVAAYQLGTYTVTPGTGIWSTSGSTISVANVAGSTLNVNVVNPQSVSGSTVTVLQGTLPWQVTGGTFAIVGTTLPVSQFGAWDVNASQAGSYTVTPGTGTFPISGSVSVSNLPAAQPVSQSGSFTVTPGTGTWSSTISGSTIQVTGLAGAAVVVDGSGFTQPISGSVGVNNFPVVQSVSQSGAFTVTPGTGAWSTSGSSVTAYQGGSWGVASSQVGSYTVTPGTGTFPISGSVAVTFPVIQTVSVNVDSTTVANPTHIQWIAGSSVTANFSSPQPVTGAFFQATQPVSVAMPVTTSVSVDSTTQSNPTWVVWGATNPVSVVNSTISLNGINLLAQDSTVNTLFKAGQNIGNTQFGASQVGSYTVTPGTGTFSVSGTVTVAFPAVQTTSVNIDSTTVANPTHVQWIAGSSVTVSFPSAQPVTIPLPVLTTVSIDSTTVANPTNVRWVAGSSVTVSFPSAQPVSVATPITTSVSVDSTTRSNPSWIVWGATNPVSVVNSTVSLNGFSLLAQDSTVNSLFKAGQSIGNTQFGASQVGSYTVTPGTGTFPISGTVSVAFPTVQTVSVNVDSTTQTNPTWIVWSATNPVVVVNSTVSLNGIALLAQDSTINTLFKAGQNIGNTSFGASQVGSYVVTPGTGSWNAAGSSVAASQIGSYTVTPGTGTWSVSTTFPTVQTVSVSVDSTTLANPTNVRWVAGSSVTVNFASPQQVSQSGPFTITPGTGVFTVGFASGSFSNPLYILSTGTVVSTGSITSFQGSSWNVGQAGSYTVTPGTGNWNGFILGSVTVTPGTGTLNVNIVSTFSSTNPGYVSTLSTFPISVNSLPLPAGAATESSLSTVVTNLGIINANITNGNATTKQTGSFTVTSGTGGWQGGLVTGSSFPSYVSASSQSLTMNTSGFTLVASYPVDGYKASYSASVSTLVVAAAATDILTITGAAGKTIRVTYIEASSTQTTSSTEVFNIIKRSAADSAGTSFLATIASHDSQNPVASAVVRTYTANPTLGASAGQIASRRVTIGNGTTGVAALITSVGTDQGIVLFKADRPSQAIVLRGSSEQLAVNFNGGTATGNTTSIYIEWSEE